MHWYTTAKQTKEWPRCKPSFDQTPCKQLLQHQSGESVWGILTAMCWKQRVCFSRVARMLDFSMRNGSVDMTPVRMTPLLSASLTTLCSLKIVRMHGSVKSDGIERRCSRPCGKIRKNYCRDWGGQNPASQADVFQVNLSNSAHTQHENSCLHLAAWSLALAFRLQVLCWWFVMGDLEQTLVHLTVGGEYECKRSWVTAIHLASSIKPSCLNVFNIFATSPTPTWKFLLLLLLKGRIYMQ